MYKSLFLQISNLFIVFWGAMAINMVEINFQIMDSGCICDLFCTALHCTLHSNNHPGRSTPRYSLDHTR